MASQKNKIALVTAWGGNFGTGHLYRMLTLLNYLLVDRNTDTCIVSDPPSFLDKKFSAFVTHAVPHDTTLIIRDMRDSTAKDIERLKKIAPVMVVDDCGEGRSLADAAIDLLPNLEFPESVKPFDEIPFLFGYNFYSSVKSLVPGDRLHKKFDFCFYAGANPSEDYISFVQSLLPSTGSTVIVNGSKTLLYEQGKLSESNLYWPEPVLFSETLISHFGVTLFESSLCDCNIFTINPSIYHSQLSDIATLNLVNFGVYPDINSEKAKKDLKASVSLHRKVLSADNLKNRVVSHTERFVKLIEPFMK